MYGVKDMHRISEVCPPGMCARLATCPDKLCSGHPLGAAAQLDELEAAARAARAGEVFVPLNQIDDFRTKDGGETVSTEDDMSDSAWAIVKFLLWLGGGLFLIAALWHLYERTWPWAAILSAISG